MRQWRLAAALIVGLATPAMADASFRTPSGNIGCSHDRAGGGRVVCLRFEPAVLSVILTANGVESGVPETWDRQMVAAGVPVLAYGQSKTLGAFTCTSRKEGLSCSGKGHGFIINRKGVRTE